MMNVATHPGNFHADDVFAVATLRLALGPLTVIRTRDDARAGACDIRVDVGGRHAPEHGDFDHHQKGGAGERPNGIRYASFGLVWSHYGADLVGSDHAAASVDERLVQGVDANDTGQTIVEALFEGVRPMTVSGLVAAMNAHWDQELSEEEENERFDTAVAFAMAILEREISGAAAAARARDLVQSAIAQAQDPRLIELTSNMPWREAVVDGAPEAQFVLYPKSDGWGMQAVPLVLGGFGNRRDLPAAWAGLSGPALSDATGVTGAMFCHTARFYVSAETREAIMALAQLALAAPPD